MPRRIKTNSVNEWATRSGITAAGLDSNARSYPSSVAFASVACGDVCPVVGVECCGCRALPPRALGVVASDAGPCAVIVRPRQIGVRFADPSFPAVTLRHPSAATNLSRGGRRVACRRAARASPRRIAQRSSSTSSRSSGSKYTRSSVPPGCSYNPAATLRCAPCIRQSRRSCFGRGGSRCGSAGLKPTAMASPMIPGQTGMIEEGVPARCAQSGPSPWSCARCAISANGNGDR